MCRRCRSECKSCVRESLVATECDCQNYRLTEASIDLLDISSTFVPKTTSNYLEVGFERNESFESNASSPVETPTSEFVSLMDLLNAPVPVSANDVCVNECGK